MESAIFILVRGGSMLGTVSSAVVNLVKQVGTPQQRYGYVCDALQKLADGSKTAAPSEGKSASKLIEEVQFFRQMQEALLLSTQKQSPSYTLLLPVLRGISNKFLETSAPYLSSGCDAIVTALDEIEAKEKKEMMVASSARHVRSASVVAVPSATPVKQHAATTTVSASRGKHFDFGRGSKTETLPGFDTLEWDLVTTGGQTVVPMRAVTAAQKASLANESEEKMSKALAELSASCKEMNQVFIKHDAVVKTYKPENIPQVQLIIDQLYKLDKVYLKYQADYNDADAAQQANAHYLRENRRQFVSSYPNLLDGIFGRADRRALIDDLRARYQGRQEPFAKDENRFQSSLMNEHMNPAVDPRVSSRPAPIPVAPAVEVKASSDQRLIAAVKLQEPLIKIGNLFAAKADVNAVDSKGWTALHHAVATGNQVVVEALTEANVDANAVNQEDKTPLDLAFETKQWSLARQLIINANAEPLADLKYYKSPSGAGANALKQFANSKDADPRQKSFSADRCLCMAKLAYALGQTDPAQTYWERATRKESELEKQKDAEQKFNDYAVKLSYEIKRSMRANIDHLNDQLISLGTAYKNCFKAGVSHKHADIGGAADQLIDGAWLQHAGVGARDAAAFTSASPTDELTHLRVIQALDKYRRSNVFNRGGNLAAALDQLIDAALLIHVSPNDPLRNSLSREKLIARLVNQYTALAAANAQHAAKAVASAAAARALPPATGMSHHARTVSLSSGMFTTSGVVGLRSASTAAANSQPPTGTPTVASPLSVIGEVDEALLLRTVMSTQRHSSVAAAQAAAAAVVAGSSTPTAAAAPATARP
jgi:hypothetical protein